MMAQFVGPESEARIFFRVDHGRPVAHPTARRATTHVSGIYSPDTAEINR
jgi:hypothetical protein